MHRRHDEWLFFRGFGGRSSPARLFGSILARVAGRRFLLDGRAQGRDGPPREVPLFLPDANQVLDLPYVLGAIREIRRRANQRRKKRLKLGVEAVAGTSELDVIEHIIQDVENM
jgi:hypothetical protein